MFFFSEIKKNNNVAKMFSKIENLMYSYCMEEGGSEKDRKKVNDECETNLPFTGFRLDFCSDAYYVWVYHVPDLHGKIIVTEIVTKTETISQ